MKNLKILLGLMFSFLVQSSFLFAQKGSKIMSACVSGDCENGIGKQKFSNNATYEGAFKGDLPHGKGKYVSDDYTYDGDFAGSMKEGKGSLWRKDGSFYTGQFARNKFEGKGKLQDAHGIYEGDFLEDKKHGKGMNTSANEIYIGEWKNDLKDGVGKLTDLKGKLIQQGTWKEGKFLK